MIELPLLVGAFVAGVLMFLAPCTLPIVPGYLAFIAGVPLRLLETPEGRRSARGQVMRNALAFVIGFSLIFILLGASAGFIGSFLSEWRYVLSRAGGAIIILFGLVMLGVVSMPALTRERRFSLPRFLALGQLPSSALIGALFALGWSPCIGPILGTILLLASGTSTYYLGAALLGVFSLGLAIPFLLTAYLVGEASLLFAKLGGFIQGLSIVGGIALVVVGILMLTGNMVLLIGWGYALLDFIGYERLLNYL